MPRTDEAEILDLMQSYARALDEKDWARYASLYGEGAELVLPWGQTVPQAEIAADTEAKLGRFARTQHLTSNQQIEVHGETAASRSYVQAVHVGHDGEIWTIGARYDSEFRRQANEWRFAHVVLSIVWETGTPPEFG